MGGTTLSTPGVAEPTASDQLAAFQSISSCPLCGDVRGKIVHTEENRLPANAAFDPFRGVSSPLRRCASCGFGYITLLPKSPEFYKALYEHHVSDWEHEFRHHGKRRIFAAALRTLNRYNPGRHLLDIGAWCGTFLEEARRQFECTGLELDAEAVVDMQRH